MKCGKPLAALLFLLTWGWWAVAGEPIAGIPIPQSAGGMLEWLADNPFAASMIVLVIVTVIGTIISRQVRDRCTRDFEGYPVTLELKDGTVYHGELDVEKTGLEFIYEKTTPQDVLMKTSFIIYKPEYGTIHALIRHIDTLNEEQRKARQKAADRAYHPGIFRRTWRAVRNLSVGLKDSIMEGFNLSMGRMKSIQASAPVMKSSGGYISKVGKQTIGSAADISYDPLLEKQIGLRVVLKVPQDAAVQNECLGTFREYTKDFFALMDLDYESQWDIVLVGAGEAAFIRGIAAQRTATEVLIENRNTFDVQFATLRIEPETEGAEMPGPVEVPVTISSGEKLEFTLPTGAGPAFLGFSSVRRADIVVPRTGAFIRHKGEWVKPRKLVGQLKDAIGLLPGTDNVVAMLKRSASVFTTQVQGAEETEQIEEEEFGGPDENG